MAKKQEMFEGMPVIEAANNNALEKKLAKMAERPAKYVVRISNKATKIKEDAFRDNEEIAAVLIPDSVTEIGRTAFSGCKGLTRLEIPASVTRIGDFEIYGCDSFVDCNLQSIVVAKDNPVYDSRKNCNAIIEKKTNILRIASNKTVIPDSVTDIGWWAFSGRTEITSIIIPDSVKCIVCCTASWSA